MLENPSKKALTDEIMKLKKFAKTNRNRKKFVGLYLAGHGESTDGKEDSKEERNSTEESSYNRRPEEQQQQSGKKPGQ